MDNKPKNSPARLKANRKYLQANYESINLALPKGTKDLYRSAATEQGYTSLNAFIKDAVEEKINRYKKEES